MRRYKRFVLQLIEACGGLKLLRWHNRLSPQVLMYHRISDAPYIAGLPPAEFEKQIAYLTKKFRVVPIDTLLSEVNNNAVKPYTIAITFDDGHSDFYEQAWPVLKKYQLPVSLYITTGFINGDLWLWPDLLKYIIINCNNRHVAIHPLGNLSFSPDSFIRSWNLLGDYCLGLTVEERNTFIQELSKITACNIPLKPVAPFLPLSWRQLQEMKAAGLDIGSHTVSHPILNGLSDNEIATEFIDSAQSVFTNLNHRTKGICYPNGRLMDINNDVINLAKKYGYSYGLLARNHPISATAPFLIGRLAAHSDFDYFKWTMARRPIEQDKYYFN